MELVDLADAPGRPRRIAVGEFDGVHLGHAAVISGCDSVLTFEPHPRAVVGHSGAPPLLTTLEQKRDAIAALGVEELVVARFDDAFSRLSPANFIDDVLVDALSAESVSIGANFRFGSGAEGDAEVLRSDGRFEVRVADLVSTSAGPVSSSRLRELVAAGELADVPVLLGRHFAMRGNVVGGERRGRELGYPTANIVPDARCVRPPNGIYSCFSNGRPAVASLGTRPTFTEGDAEVLLEVHVIGFKGDLYGQQLDVEFLEMLRVEERFAGEKELIEQMDRDLAAAAESCAAHGG